MATVGLLASAGPVDARPAPAELHCVVAVTGKGADGRLITSSPVCFGARRQASAAVGIASTIAVHYDGSNFTGSSITITGSDCGGGWLNLSLWWRNRISSSSNFCPVTRFFDGLNLTGSSEAMGGSGNLGLMNNRSESVQYSS